MHDVGSPRPRQSRQRQSLEPCTEIVASEHFGHLINIGQILGVRPDLSDAPALAQLKQRQAIQKRPSGDSKEVLAVGFGAPVVAFGEIGFDGCRSWAILIRQTAMAPREVIGDRQDLIGEVDDLWSTWRFSMAGAGLRFDS